MTTATRQAVTLRVGALRDAVRMAASVIRGNTPIEILRAVRITPGLMASTDMETTAFVDVGGLDLDCLVVGASLRSALEVMPADDPVALTLSDGTLELECGRLRSTLPLLAAEDYPELPKVGASADPVPAELVEQMRACAGACSGDDTRPVLQALNLGRGADGRWWCWGCDSYRLWRWREPAADGYGAVAPWHAMLRPGALRALPKGEAVRLGVDGPMVRIEAGPLTLLVRQVEGTPPDPDQLVPAKFEAEVRFTDEAVAQVVALCAPFRGADTGPGVSPVRMEFAKGSQTVVMSVHDDHMAARVEVELEAPHTGDDVTIGANPKFLAPSLEFGGPRLRFISPIRPLLFDGLPGRDALMMPIRLSS